MCKSFIPRTPKYVTGKLEISGTGPLRKPHGMCWWEWMQGDHAEHKGEVTEHSDPRKELCEVCRDVWETF